MNDAFTVRELCPGCHHDSCSQLYSASLAHAPISDYLEAFYASQGGIDLSALEGGHYVLMECGHCGLIFQRDVLSDRLMYRLYENGLIQHDRWTSTRPKEA